LFGGTFNPPHLGHLEVAKSVVEELNPDLLLIIPANIPPHKEYEECNPDAIERLELCRLNFSDLPNTQISDIEIMREGKSYTADTLEELINRYPESEFTFVLGSDMLLCFEDWYKFRFLLENMTIAVYSRNIDDELDIKNQADYLTSEYNAKIVFIHKEPMPMASTDIRELLSRRSGNSYLKESVYERIIKNNDYDAKADLYWLREKAFSMLKPNRVAHVAGVESEAVSLAQHWGENIELAAEAGILHDITKKLSLEEQLILCDRYGIIVDNLEKENVKLLHSKTGAALAKDLFNISDEVYNAIWWHTTGKPDMNLLEKIVYMADYIEPNRDFPGVEDLRDLAYNDLDKAMALGLEMSLEDIRSYGIEPHPVSIEAYNWYNINS